MAFFAFVGAEMESAQYAVLSLQYECCMKRKSTYKSKMQALPISPSISTKWQNAAL